MCKRKKHAQDIYVIADTQVKPGVRNPLIAVAHDVVKTKPDTVIHLGDHWDMPSLSSYDKAKNSFSARRYVADIEAGNEALREFWFVIDTGRANNKDWKCTFIILEGNHEDRIARAKEAIPTEFQGLLDLQSRDYEGWDKVVTYLDIITINGVAFSHQFLQPTSGRPFCSANSILSKRHTSFVQGHRQVLEQAEHTSLTGKRLMGLIIGACYYHDEEYKHQGNDHFRGVALLKNVYKGEWDIDVRSLKNLHANMVDEIGGKPWK